MLSNQKSHSNYMKGQNRLLTLLAFACIYFIWGSTYLAIRYAVETIPPLFVASFRHLIAGGLLFGWCWWRGLRPTRKQWFASIVLGALFFLIGHGTLHWAQQTLPSGVAAFLIATEPIFVAIILAATRRTRHHPDAVNWFVAGIIRRCPHYWRRPANRSLPDAKFICSSDRHSLLVYRDGLFTQCSATS